MNFVNPIWFLADPGKETGKDVMLRTALFIVVAAIFFIAGWAGQYNARSKPFIKYLSLIPLIVAAKWGKEYYDFANDSWNNATQSIGGSSKPLYIAAFFVPIAFIVIFVVAGVFVDQKIKADRAVV